MIPSDDQTPMDTTEEDSSAGVSCAEPAGSPVSDTPETDEALVDHMPANETEWSEHYLKLSIHARKMERERDAARVPICIGRPIIEILAAEGVWPEWTHDTPTESGHYWWQHDPKCVPYVVEVRPFVDGAKEARFPWGNTILLDRKSTARWAGPIPLPRCHTSKFSDDL